MAFVPNGCRLPRAPAARSATSRGRPRMCAAPASARAALWREVGALRGALAAAVRAERYADAARLRDAIEALSLTDEYVSVERALRAAVAEQRFRDAARLRDALATLEPPPPHASAAGDGDADAAGDGAPRRAAWSQTTTHGVTVRVESYYMPEQSRPRDRRFLFGYRVRITNGSPHTCQLVARRWTVSSTGNRDTEVRGPGVVGRQPVLEPGDEFEYTSACPISVDDAAPGAVLGSMKGVYEMCRGDTGAITFRVDIDPFYFRLPRDGARDGA